jgi:hypothetical protein
MPLVIVGGSLFYQFRHPWHWLTYGQNASALSVAVSAVGLIVIVLYTLYTRRMMLLAGQTRRGELYPILALQEEDETPDGYLQLVILNLGGGPFAEWIRMAAPGIRTLHGR